MVIFNFQVYKCDNSKLLQEVNRLKLELLNNERKIQTENIGELQDIFETY